MTEDIRKKTDHLIRLLNEKADGYRIASNEVKDDNLSIIFNDYADKNLSLANQLLEYSHAGTPSDAYRTDGKATVTWNKLKASLAARNNEHILDAFIKKEGEVIRTYEEMLEEEDLPSELNERIQDHIENMLNAQRELQKEKISEYS